MTEQQRPDRLWRHPQFGKLWAAQVASLAGSQVSRLAIPLTAVIVLQATPAQMGIQSMCWTVGMVLAALLAGPWVDRLPRRRIMIGADVGCALLLASVPAAAAAGVLHIEQLYVVSLLGVRTVLAIAAVGMILAAAWVFFSPVRGLTQAPSGSSKEFAAITSR